MAVVSVMVVVVVNKEMHGGEERGERGSVVGANGEGNGRCSKVLKGMEVRKSGRAL